MRASAKRKNKAVPTVNELNKLCQNGMACPDCAATMNWLGRDSQEKVVTLQHYRDGSFGLVCRSCNTRHAYSPGDTFRGTGGGLKFCPHCKEFKPLSAFSKDAGRSGTMKIKSWCRECSHQSHTEWRIKNREYYNAKQREYRAIRSA
jgi:hypothetical protein